MAGEHATKIGKKSFISLEIFIMAVSMIAALIMTWNSLNNSIKKNSHDITSLEVQMAGFVMELKEISSTLTEMLVESRIQNELTKLQAGNCWSADMEETQEDGWKQLIKKMHPEVDWALFPNVKQTQRIHGVAP